MPSRASPGRPRPVPRYCGPAALNAQRWPLKEQPDGGIGWPSTVMTNWATPCDPDDPPPPCWFPPVPVAAAWLITALLVTAGAALDRPLRHARVRGAPEPGGALHAGDPGPGKGHREAPAAALPGQAADRDLVGEAARPLLGDLVGDPHLAVAAAPPGSAPVTGRAAPGPPLAARFRGTAMGTPGRAEASVPPWLGCRWQAPIGTALPAPAS